MNEPVMGKRILETLTSSLYFDPSVLFREYVQNSLDSKIHCGMSIDDFNVEIVINKKDKKITITDNGPGIPFEEFNKKMVSFGGSTKSREEIGYRGIGRLSALPFCDKLIFKNKTINNTQIQVCEWDSKAYKNFLDDGKDQSLESIFDEICSFKTEESSECNQCFSVVIENYTEEIESIICDKGFESRLKKLLPLKYNPNFTKSSEIISAYKEYLHKDMNQYMCNVSLDGVPLYKEYSNDELGAIGIRTVRIAIKSGSELQTIGFIWHTFDQKIEVRDSWKKNGIEGIFVRSKNIQMGSNFTIANKLDGIAAMTYSEMYATLRGVSGELHICTNLLEDNSGRDWFKPSSELRSLIDVLNQYLVLVKKYRYQSSKYYNAVNSNKDDSEKEKTILDLKEKTKSALANLLNENIEEAEKIVTKYDAPVAKESDQSDSSGNGGSRSSETDVDTKETYSEKDIPEESVDVKRFYDDIMKIVENQLRSVKKYTLIDKIRSTVRLEYNEKRKKENPPGGA